MDEATFKKYKNGFQNIEDWRRNNVDILVKAISDALKKEKPRVKFGISPFGVWRNANTDPAGSITTGGQTSYDNLYADTRKWIKNGWIDYIAPQIYFSFEFDKVPYKNLAEWWLKNAYGRHLYIGQGAYRVKAGSKEAGWNKSDQIPRQIRYNRTHSPISGSIFFSAKSLIKNELGLTDSLKNYYATPALMPTMPWKDNIPPNPPQNIKVRRMADVGTVITWEVATELPRDKEDTYGFVIYRFEENEPINLENSAKMIHIMRNEGILSFVDRQANDEKKYIYIITALDRLQNESQMSSLGKIK
jgi:uncharacterized lipoprotein YddW (UPF0748 family)